MFTHQTNNKFIQNYQTQQHTKVCVYVLFTYESFLYFLKNIYVDYKKSKFKNSFIHTLVFILNILNIYLLFIFK
jgi:hypothetical protein